MFDDIVIVQSAISAFNNAALLAPAFLWWAILSLPLMVLVWMCAPVIQNKLSLNLNNINARGGVILSALTFVWVVLFGGNYGVLRDSVSVLPFMVAVIVFLTSLFVSSHMRELPDIKLNARARFAVCVLLLFALVMSDMHAWWGPFLQVGACGLGWIMGRMARGAMRPVAGMVLIMLVVTVAMLMQPEFFRFGQLGNLTFAHLIFVLLIGVCGMAVIALNNVSPREKIHRSAYVKLKWMFRVISLLMAALFMLTESVPLFLGMCGAFLLMFMLSIWHAKSVPSGLMERVLSVMIMLFGALTTMPVVTAIGVVYMTMLPRVNFLREIRALL